MFPVVGKVECLAEPARASGIRRPAGLIVVAVPTKCAGEAVTLLLKVGYRRRATHRCSRLTWFASCGRLLTGGPCSRAEVRLGGVDAQADESSRDPGVIDLHKASEEVRRADTALAEFQRVPECEFHGLLDVRRKREVARGRSLAGWPDSEQPVTDPLERDLQDGLSRLSTGAEYAHQ